MYCDGYAQMAKIKINCGGLQMQVGGLDRYMGGISPNSQKPVAVGASNSISGRASAPDVPEQVEKTARTTVGAAEGLPLPKLPDELICHFLIDLNPTEIAKMREVSTLYNNIIKRTLSLNQKVQHGRYLSLAKQAAEGIQDDYEKSKAYCAIATEEAKSNLEEAKQTVDRIQYDYWKSKSYCAIATALLHW